MSKLPLASDWLKANSGFVSSEKKDELPLSGGNGFLEETSVINRLIDAHGLSNLDEFDRQVDKEVECVLREVRGSNSRPVIKVGERWWCDGFFPIKPNDCGFYPMTGTAHPPDESSRAPKKYGPDIPPRALK